jgi:hypothetical protein
MCLNVENHSNWGRVGDIMEVSSSLLWYFSFFSRLFQVEGGKMRIYYPQRRYILADSLFAENVKLL